MTDLRTDGLPTLPTGEPVLHRWFVVLMLLLVPVGVAVTVWAFVAVEGTTISAAERRPPGSAEETHPRGGAVLNEIEDTEPGPGCAAGVTLFGDVGARATARRAVSAVCSLADRGVIPRAEQGLAAFTRDDGIVRFAVFEVTGLDSSTRIEDGRPVVELNAKFQFADASEVVPTLVHELVHVGEPLWPGAPLTAEAELAAVEEQAAACDALVFPGQPPRTCLDSRALLASSDPLGDLVAAGYRRAR